MSIFPRSFRSLYFGAWAILIVLVHQSFLADVVGFEASRWLRRNGEAYLLVILIPLFWELFAKHADPARPSEAQDGPAAPRQNVVLWFTAMAVLTVVLQNSWISSGLGLPDSIVTYGEAFYATGVVTAYLAWSRGLLSEGATGAPVVSALARAGYYIAVGLLTALFHQSFVADRLSSAFVDWWTLNAEAWGAMLVVPLWFDLVAGRPWPKLLAPAAAWAALLIVVPAAFGVGQGEADSVAGTMIGDLSIWIGRTTEAFIAALVIGIYFGVWRRLPQLPWTPTQEPDRAQAAAMAASIRRNNGRAKTSNEPTTAPEM